MTVKKILNWLRSLFRKHYSFQDLKFNAHAVKADAIQAKLDLGNGLQISVVAMKDKDQSFGGLYGNASKGTYEVAVFRNDSMIPLASYDDVLGWQTKDDINKLMDNLQGDGAKDFIDNLHLAKAQHQAGANFRLS